MRSAQETSQHVCLQQRFMHMRMLSCVPLRRASACVNPLRVFIPDGGVFTYRVRWAVFGEGVTTPGGVRTDPPVPTPNIRGLGGVSRDCG